MGRKTIRGDGRSNVLEKLEGRIAEGDHYGALQMYKTLYSRHLNAEEFSQASQLAESAACALIKYKKTTAACEMGLLMVQSFSAGNSPVNSESKGSIRAIKAAFDANQCSGPELAQLLKQAVKWSAEKGSRKRGDPELQLLLAQTYRELQDFASASKHYLHSEQPLEFTEMLQSWAATGLKSEKDLYMGRAVLQLLSLENLKEANVVFERTKDTLEQTPLVHFLRFLLLTLERDALPLFQMLQDKYSISLNRDESFKTYMSLIGQKFYGLKPPQNGLSALLNMFGGGL